MPLSSRVHIVSPKKSFEFINRAIIRPVQALDAFTVDMNDNNFRIETELKYKFHRHFGVSYVNVVRSNQRNENRGVSDSEITHGFLADYEKRF